MVTNLPLGKSWTIRSFRRASTSPGPQPASASERSIPRVADIKSAAAVPLPETSASTNPHLPSLNGIKSYQSVIDHQRDGYFRQRRLLARDVIGVPAHVRCVAHLAGGGHMADHAIFPDFQNLPFFMSRAAADTGEN